MEELPHKKNGTVFLGATQTISFYFNSYGSQRVFAADGAGYQPSLITTLAPLPSIPQKTIQP